jgi:COP9 signalosome complex subunit 5
MSSQSPTATSSSAAPQPSSSIQSSSTSTQQSTSTSTYAPTSPSTTSLTTGYDHYYSYNEKILAQQRNNKPWDSDDKYFKECHVSALAAMKMLKHAIEGVEKGRNTTNTNNPGGAALGGTPIEILGLLIGKFDGNRIIITDACPLPVEGSETRVVADDAQVHMLDLLESLELRRKDKFVGWYHSHPFDLQSYSHCHLSAIDVETQATWQTASPTWVAIVVDPFRSLARQELDIGCYRVYSQRHTNTQAANICPDGTICNDSQQRIMRWGASYQRYYSLKISYYLSTLGRQLLDAIDEKNFWMRYFSSLNYESEQQNEIVARMVTSSSHIGAHASKSMIATPTLRKDVDKPFRLSHGRPRNDDLTVEGLSNMGSIQGLNDLAEMSVDACAKCSHGYGRNLLKHLLFNISRKNASSSDQMEG